jgi:hypothetical protein
VNALLNAADAALHSEDFLRAHQLIEELDAEGDRKMTQWQQDLLEAL